MSEYIKIALNKLKPFSGTLYDDKGEKCIFNGNPFEDEDEEALKQLRISIEQDGLLSPIFVRKAHSVGQTEDTAASYEILSGYRRKKVCEELAKTNPEFSEITARVIECDDEAASSIITSANVQRRKISLLDAIKSCGRMYLALQHQGKKKKDSENGDNSINTGDNKETVDIVAQITGLKARKIRTYSQLLKLPEEMLQLVGNKSKTQDGVLRLSMRAGEALVTLSKKQLSSVNKFLKRNNDTFIIHEQAKAIRKFCKKNNTITQEDIERIISADENNALNAPSENSINKNKKLKLSFNEEKVRNYCPNMSNEQIEELVLELLEKHFVSKS